MKHSRILLGLALLALALASAGCARPTLVPLTYPTTLGDTPWCRWDLTITAFTDARADRKVLGDQGEGVNYTAEGNVTDWVGRAFFDELKNRGCGCVYKPDLASAGQGYAIGGQVLLTRLDKIGFNQWKAVVQVQVTLARAGEPIYTETYTSELEKPFVIATDAEQKILADALQGLVTDASLKLIDHMRLADGGQ